MVLRKGTRNLRELPLNVADGTEESTRNLRELPLNVADGAEERHEKPQGTAFKCG